MEKLGSFEEEQTAMGGVRLRSQFQNKALSSVYAKINKKNVISTLTMIKLPSGPGSTVQKAKAKTVHSLNNIKLTKPPSKSTFKDKKPPEEEEDGVGIARYLVTGSDENSSSSGEQDDIFSEN